MRRAWTVSDSLELYGVANWGDGFFGVNAQGHRILRSEKHTGDLPGAPLRTLPMLDVAVGDTAAAREQQRQRQTRSSSIQSHGFPCRKST